MKQKIRKMSAIALFMSVGVGVAAGVVASPAVAAPASTAALPDVVANGYHMTFSDEFDGDKLDTSKWGYQYGCFDPGQRTQAQYTDSPDNVSVHDGYLNLTARYSPMKTKSDGSQIPRTCKSGSTTYDAPFTSGMISTKKSDGAVLYAAPASGFYVEARIKLPSARSSWSSFWTVGSKKELGNWPGNGEIDVFESKGYDPNYLMSNTHSPQAGNPKKSEQHQGMMFGDKGTSQYEFHTYGMLKTADAIEFYFDGHMTHRVKMSDIRGTNPFVDPDNNYILKLNQMVGGNYLAGQTRQGDWSDKTYVDATKFADDYKNADGVGSTMYVDYVRVYEPKTDADQADKPAEPAQPQPVPSEPSQPEQPAQPTPTPAPENPVTPTPEQPAQPAEPTPAPAPETPVQPENPVQPAPAQPENPVTPAQPAQPEQPAPAPAPTPTPEPTQPSQPAPVKPTPAQPAPAVPAKPQPAQPQPAPAEQTQPAQPEQSQQAEQPTQPKKSQQQQKPRPDRLANTGMTSWYRPIVVAWNNFCSWITSWWFW